MVNTSGRNGLQGQLPYLGRASRAGRSRRSSRTLGTRSRSAKVLRTVVTGAVAGHAHVVRRRGGRAVGGTNTRVVLRATPAQTDARVTNRVTLHLVDGHLSGMAVDELNEAAALARGDLDVGDLAESLEERSKLILGNVAGKASNEDGGVVGIGELVHLGGRVKTSVRETLHTTPHLLLRHTTSHHRAVLVASVAAEAMVAAKYR